MTLRTLAKHLDFEASGDFAGFVGRGEIWAKVPKCSIFIPGVATPLWEVTGVLYRGGVPAAARPSSSAPQAKKILAPKSPK